MNEKNRKSGYYIALFSLHGLIRGDSLELGKDSDNGGQIKYVVELAKALGRHPMIEKVDLFTRLVQGAEVDECYSQPFEALNEKASIRRISCGPRRYIKKESLWPYLDIFADNTLKHFREKKRLPDILHAHYADAGYVGSVLSSLLNIPLVFTGHSLGRVKRQRLLDDGIKEKVIERQYSIGRRIEAEENVLEHASLVITSTRQEIMQQYAMYDHHQSKRMLVVPPGTELDRFKPPSRLFWREEYVPLYDEVLKFLREPKKPMILALSRADHRKNITGLIKAYGENKELQELANLVIIAGSRDDLRKMEAGTMEVLNEILYLIDLYDLYGKVSYPKSHSVEDVSALYRLAAKNKGVFVNPALTEPFGLTLIEAAASGLPIVATNDGGPMDIIDNCRNGLLIDPLDNADIAGKILQILSDSALWRKYSKAGISGAKRHYAWERHVQNYLKAVRRIFRGASKTNPFPKLQKKYALSDRAIICDIDNTLTGDGEALRELSALLEGIGEYSFFGVATGRSLPLVLEVLEEWKIPFPDVMITSVGSSIHFGPTMVRDRGWEQHINYRWVPDAVREHMLRYESLSLQPPKGQGAYKVSYVVDEENPLDVDEIVRNLRRENIYANVIYSHGQFLDILPIRASKGAALRYFAMKMGIPLERCLVAGDSGNDIEMLKGNSLGVVVGNHSPELEKLRKMPKIYFAKGVYARGILEGIDHYAFLTKDMKPDE